MDPAIEGETRKILTPKFSHKIGSVMQIKNEAKGGANYDDMELVWDEAAGEYILKAIVNTEQMSIFDAEFKCVNDPEKTDESEEEQLALTGRCAAALPGPVDTPGECDDGFGRDDEYGYEPREEF